MGLKIGPLRLGGSGSGVERGRVFSGGAVDAEKREQELLGQRVGTVDYLIKQGVTEINDLIEGVTGVRGFDGLNPEQLKEVVTQAVNERDRRRAASENHVPPSSGSQ